MVAGFGNDGASGFEGCRLGNAIGTYLHGPLLPRNPWLADWLLAQAVAHRTGEEPTLPPLADELEAEHMPSRPSAHAREADADSRGASAPNGSPLMERRRALDVRSGCPERAEIDDRVPGLPALEKALDRRMQDDVVELVEPEQPVAAHRDVLGRHLLRASDP